MAEEFEKAQNPEENAKTSEQYMDDDYTVRPALYDSRSGSIPSGTGNDMAEPEYSSGKKRSGVVPAFIMIAAGVLLLIFVLVLGSRQGAYNRAVDSFNEGVEYYYQEKWSEAYRAFHTAAEKNVPDAEIWSELSSARASIERKNFEMARQSLERLQKMECSDDLQEETALLMDFVMAHQPTNSENSSGS